jgi:tetratricopeptide (TPR) repeat protein
MRQVQYLLLISLMAVSVPGPASSGPSAGSSAKLEALLTSEFAFQSGQFTQSFRYYRQTPKSELSSQERLRGSQIAAVLADQAWQSALLEQSVAGPLAPAEQVSRLEMAIRLKRGAEALTAWRSLLLTQSEADAGSAMAVIAGQDETLRPFLLGVLREYAARPDLTRFERMALFHLAREWSQAELADSLGKPIDAATAEGALLAILKACQTPKSPDCLQRMQNAEPSDYREANRRRLVQLAQNSGDAEQAWRWWLAMPQDSSSYYQRILLLSNAMNQDKARALMAEIQKAGQLSPFQRYALAGSLAELQEDWTSAEASYRAAIGLDVPTSAAVRLPVVLLRQNRRDEAIAYLQSVSGSPRYSDEIRRDALLIELQVHGMLPPERRDAAMINEVYKRALTLWPQAQLLRYQLAMRYFRQDKTDLAMRELQALLRLAPANADALNAYGFTMAKDLDKPRKALQPIQQAYLLAPERPEILDSYGYVLHRIGRHREALDPLQKAWRMTPSAATAGHLAQVYWQLGERQLAKDYLDKGLQIDAQEAELLRLREQWR